MLERIVRKIVSIVLKGSDDEQQRVLCEYGCEILLHTFFCTIGLMVIGIVLNSVLETIIIIGIFYACQNNGSGYHASSHFRCFLIMAVGLIIGIAILRFLSSRFVFIAVMLCSAAVMIAVPVQLNRNKKYLFDKIITLSKRSMCVTGFITIGIIFLALIGLDRYVYSCCIAMFFSSVSRVAALCQRL